MAGDSKVGALPLLAAWLLTATAYVARAVATAGSTPLIVDTDDAMRLTMVHDLLDGQGWFDLVQHRLNTPFGASMHWSRLVDAPQALLLWALRPLLGGLADVALAYLWPLLLLALLLWTTAKLALLLGGRQAKWPALLLTAPSLIAMTEFIPGRLDHHNVQILLALAMLYCAIAALGRPRFALGAGVAAGAALTIGVEALPMVGATVLAFGLAWVASERQAVALRDFGLSFALTTALGLAQGVPPALWLVPRADAISITYGLGAALCGAAFLILSRLSLRPLAGRLAAGAIAGGIVLAGVVASYPTIAGGPYAELDPWLIDNWIDSIAEAEPFLRALTGDPIYPTSVAVPVITGLAVIAWCLISRPAQRRTWLVYGLFLTLAFVVMLLQIRAARFAVPLAVPAGAVLVGATWHRMVTSKGFGPIFAMLGSVLASAGLGVAVLATLALAAIPGNGAQRDTLAPERNACLMPQAFSALAGMPPQRLMTPVDLGSHVLLYTHHAVVAAPYHRNQEGVRDAFRFFNEPIEAERGLLARRGITLVVICPAMREIIGLVAHTPDSFVTLYAEGRLPAWLRDVTPAGSALTIYSVEP